MLFTSYTFIAFMAVVLLAYYLVPKKWQWPLLLVASYVFYWCADPRYLLFIGVTTVSTYFVSRWLEKVNAQQKSYLAEHKAELSKDEKKAYKNKMKKKKWHILLLCLIFNLGILSVTKYTNFVITNINSFLAGGHQLSTVDMIVPMGISFYTFQTMGYIIDVYRDKQKVERNPFKLALFVSFFPQLVQGPISRFGDLSKTLYEPHKFEGKTFSYGLMRILWGYFKKMVIADRLITAVTALIGSTDYTGTYVFVAMLFYAFQLYCDFTGGIDITIGIAQAMGINLAENFNLPYFSRNIKEYWNRWHITMGTWFTDYIFYPISVCKPMLKLSKWSREHLGPAVGKRVTVYLSSFAVWLTTGIWHGAAWNFIVWGLANWVVIMVSQELEPLYEKFHNKFHFKGKGWYTVFEVIRTILLMSAIRMFDCYRDVPLTFRMVGSMFTQFKVRFLWNNFWIELPANISNLFDQIKTFGVNYHIPFLGDGFNITSLLTNDDIHSLSGYLSVASQELFGFLEPSWDNFLEMVFLFCDKIQVLWDGSIVQTFISNDNLHIMLDIFPIKPVFTAGNLQTLWDGSLLQLGLSSADYILLAVCLLIVLGVSLLKVKFGSVRDVLYSKPRVLFYGVMIALFMAIIIFGAYGIGFDSSQFIYNQF